MVSILVLASAGAREGALRTILPPEYQVAFADVVYDIRSTLQGTRADAVLFDVADADAEPETIQRLLSSAGSLPFAPPMIVLSPLRNDESIVGAIHAGAFDYIVKPYSATRLLRAIERAVIARSIASSRLDEETTEIAGEQFLGSSGPAREVRYLIRSFSCADAPVLLQGESGTGKELAARLIHGLSRRAAGPFEAVNCAAVPETLFESEFFGSERGAFTGAVSRPGSFERSAGGTLFLDEISETTLHAQAKLLRSIESGTIVRIGGGRKLTVDQRLISATNCDLDARVAAGGFRDDLFFRVCVLLLKIPPLRERLEDIPLLAWHWLRLLHPASKSFAPEAIERLVSHRWPGNTRELRNVVHRSVLMCPRDRLGAADIRLSA
ncbi:MAG: sigma-54-dependent Fis family transcriptional regulator [Spirochaetaceae bacterium]|nr:MAG: sigma-54-dependent Fis family transcriptional regulator [Spirochaetaceae bacterium]